jgi:hypothetical protein
MPMNLSEFHVVSPSNLSDLQGSMSRSVLDLDLPSNQSKSPKFMPTNLSEFHVDDLPSNLSDLQGSMSRSVLDLVGMTRLSSSSTLVYQQQVFFIPLRLCSFLLLQNPVQIQRTKENSKEDNPFIV